MGLYTSVSPKSQFAKILKVPTISEFKEKRQRNQGDRKKEDVTSLLGRGPQETGSLLGAAAAVKPRAESREPLSLISQGAGESLVTGRLVLNITAPLSSPSCQPRQGCNQSPPRMVTCTYNIKAPTLSFKCTMCFSQTQNKKPLQDAFLKHTRLKKWRPISSYF